MRFAFLSGMRLISLAFAGSGPARTYVDWTIFSAIRNHPGAATIILLLIALAVAIFIYRVVRRIQNEVEEMMDTGRHRFRSARDYWRRSLVGRRISSQRPPDDRRKAG